MTFLAAGAALLMDARLGATIVSAPEPLWVAAWGVALLGVSAAVKSRRRL